MTDAHFASAAQAREPASSAPTEKAAQKAAQQTAAGPRSVPQSNKGARGEMSGIPRKCEGLQNNATPCENKGLQPVGAVGFEQSSETPKRASVPATGGAESGALGSAARTANAELSEIATTWPTLPPEVRNMILGVIRCTFRTDQ